MHFYGLAASLLLILHSLAPGHVLPVGHCPGDMKEGVDLGWSLLTDLWASQIPSICGMFISLSHKDVAQAEKYAQGMVQ